MTKSFLNLLLIIVFALIACQKKESTDTNQTSQLTKGLVGFYPFNGNALDESGFGNNGVVNGAVLCPDRFSNSNKAYKFNGSSNYIQVPNSTKNNFDTAYAICVWVNANSGYGSGSANSTHNHVVSKWGNGGSGKAAYVLGVNTGGNPLTYLHDGISNYGFIASMVMPIQSWHFLVAQYTNGTLSFYYDGQLVQIVSNVPKPQNSTFPLDFGREGGTNIAFFNGCIDDIRLYNRSLTLSEVQQLYNLK